VADADPGAEVFLGLRHPSSREAFETALRDGTVESLVHCESVHTGDSVFVPSGRLHAIGGGTLILEVQENSDTTYRVFDWNRRGLDGKPRELHIERSLACIDFEDVAPRVAGRGGGDPVIADCPQFRIRRYSLPREGGLPGKDAGSGPWLIHVVKGAVEEKGSGERLRAGDHGLAPYAEAVTLVAEGDCEVLVTDRFGKGRVE
jgi:mannose-6-phosphate isomerase